MGLWRTIILIVVAYFLFGIAYVILHQDELNTVTSIEQESYTISKVYKTDHFSVLYRDKQGVNNYVNTIDASIVYTNNSTSTVKIKTSRNQYGDTIKKEYVFYISSNTPTSPFSWKDGATIKTENRTKTDEDTKPLPPWILYRSRGLI